MRKKYNRYTSLLLCSAISACADVPIPEETSGQEDADVTEIEVTSAALSGTGQFDKSFDDDGAIRAFDGMCGGRDWSVPQVGVTSNGAAWIAGSAQAWLGDTFLMAGLGGKLTSSGSYDNNWGVGWNSLALPNADKIVEMVPVSNSMLIASTFVSNGHAGSKVTKIGSVTSDRDTTFGTGNGELIVSGLNRSDVAIAGMAPMAGGKIAIAGTANNISNGVATDKIIWVRRLNANGSADTTFPTKTIAVSTLGDVRLAVGKGRSDVFVLFSTWETAGSTIYKISSTGVLDTSFSDNGHRTFQGYYASAMAARADGSVYVDLHMPNYGGVVIKHIKADGTNNDGFSGNGSLTINVIDKADFGDGNNYYVRNLLYSEEYGRLFTFGDTSTSNSEQTLLMLGFRPDGTLDPSFDGDGVLQFNFGHDTYANDTVLAGDKITTLGYQADDDANIYGQLFARIRVFHGSDGQACNANGTCNSGYTCTQAGPTGGKYSKCIVTPTQPPPNPNRWYHYDCTCAGYDSNGVFKNVLVGGESCMDSADATQDALGRQCWTVCNQLGLYENDPVPYYPDWNKPITSACVQNFANSVRYCTAAYPCTCDGNCSTFDGGI